MEESLKIKKRIGAHNTNIELVYVLLSKCHHPYYKDCCTKCEMVVHILNRHDLNTAEIRNELPNDYLQHLLKEYSIFGLTIISKDITFSPLNDVSSLKNNSKLTKDTLIVNENKSVFLNWMQDNHSAKNIFIKQILCPFQCDWNSCYRGIYYFQPDEEILVDFGKEDRLKNYIIIDSVSSSELFTDVTACKFCCRNDAYGQRFIEDLTQCPFCKIFLNKKVYYKSQKVYCWKRNNRQCILPAVSNKTLNLLELSCTSNKYKTWPREICKCLQCSYITGYKIECSTHIFKYCNLKAFIIDVRTAKKDNDYRCLKCEFAGNNKPEMEQYLNGQHKEAAYKSLQYKTYSQHQFVDDDVVLLKQYVNTNYDKGTSHKHLYYNNKRKCETYLQLAINGKCCKGKAFGYLKCYFKTNKANLRNCLLDKILTKEESSECLECDYKTNYEDKAVKCLPCGYETNNELHLRLHVRLKHSKDGGSKCLDCDYKTKYNSALKIQVNAKLRLPGA